MYKIGIYDLTILGQFFDYSISCPLANNILTCKDWVIFIQNTIGGSAAAIAPATFLNKDISRVKGKITHFGK